jgi:3-methylfumaryl-CoA hydratase
MTNASPDKSTPRPAEATPAQAWTQREETCTLAGVRRVAAMLDLDPDTLATGQALPRGWHFLLLAADTRRSALRSDGFPGLGVPMPDLGLPRLMLGGRAVSFHQDIPIGAAVTRRSGLRSLVHKTTSAGQMAIVTLAHELHLGAQDDPALVETQTYLLMPARPAGSPAPSTPPSTLPGKPVQAMHQASVTPDETLLFQYSALGFNSHRIHLDLDHARGVEGFPGLVVNGGLATLLLTEFLRRDLGVVPGALTVRHVAPLYAHRPITLTADAVGAAWSLKAYDDQHRLAIDMEVTAR